MKDQEEREADAVIQGLEGLSGRFECGCGRVFYYSKNSSRIKCVCGAVWESRWHRDTLRPDWGWSRVD